jgi:hypothetical protein
MQAASSRQYAAGSKQQAADITYQAAGSRQHEASRSPLIFPLETFIAYETVHVLKTETSGSNTTSWEEVTDETRRRLVSKSGGSSNYEVYGTGYEMFWPREGDRDWFGTNGAIWCHTTLRFLIFVVVIMLWASMAMKLYWRLYCFRLMVKVNADLLRSQPSEVKRKATDFDASAYNWPESIEFTTSVAVNISRANDEDGGIEGAFDGAVAAAAAVGEGIEHFFARSSVERNRSSSSRIDSEGAETKAKVETKTEEQDQQLPLSPRSVKRERSFGPDVMIDPQEPSMASPCFDGQGKVSPKQLGGALPCSPSHSRFISPIKSPAQPFTSRTLEGAEEAKVLEIDSDDESVGQIRLAASTREDSA